jgi:uncharacterized protein YndB with AHSA1/START domain
MSTQTGATTIHHEIVVDAPQARAFEVFTTRMDAIKPREHNLLRVDIAETVLEPREGGSIYDRGVDGTECHWARILAFEPPARLVFAWLISARWDIEDDPANASEVEIRFVPEAEDRTRVVLEHRHLDRHGAGWESVRDGAGGEQGWPVYLGRYAALMA